MVPHAPWQGLPPAGALQRTGKAGSAEWGPHAPGRGLPPAGTLAADRQSRIRASD
jgi:hypothetical protein